MSQPPELNAEKCERNKAKGMSRAEIATGKIWVEDCIEFVRGYPNTEPFKIEEVRVWCHEQGFREPYSIHCWGPIAKKFVAAGIMRVVGTDKTINPNCHAAVVSQYVMIF